ncbi:glutathione synthetase isoform X2 [Apis cerana]|uniref:glutathione synthetase isoform X2 n=1 Tax=Apis cerana TaxID=7461 RepID=UPI002B225BB8|nr:glutathione synthetase isoform X2 [Apis cerana]
MEISRLQPCIQLQLSKEELESIIDKAKDWALMHGISMRSKVSFNKNQVQVLPFTLLPSSFPRKNFEKAKNIQILLNELIHKVAHNNDFLTESLKSTIDADPFTAKLFSIYETVYKEGFSQTLSLGLFRSDYMLHENQIKQVELNTIASSFGGIVTITSQYHKFILSELGHIDKIKNIPENNPINGLCKGLIHAWKLYGNKNGNLEVSVVYFRSGYEVEAYPTEREWQVRLLIERSQAIKCPSIHYHLAGTKKVQQSLAYPNALNIFLKDNNKIKQIQEVYAGLYSLEFNNEAEEIINNAISNPKKYVLKPQREGGGNNIYNEDIKLHFESMKNSKERTAWILMDRFYPPVQNNYIVRVHNEPFEDNQLHFSDVVSELGIYGIIIGNHNSIIHNEEVGHVLRTKPSNENEGGIAAGIGAIDSPYLID